MKFLVTGANGFIASVIVEQLLQAGHQLVLVSRRGEAGFSLNQVTTILMDFNQCLDPIGGLITCRVWMG